MNDLDVQIAERLHRQAAKAVPRFDLPRVVADAHAGIGTFGSAVDRQPRRLLTVAASCVLVTAGLAAMAVHVSRSDPASSSSDLDLAETSVPAATTPTRQIVVAIGDSMAPTLRDGDIITVELRADPADVPYRFAIVAITRTDDGVVRTLVKRVIGLPGETVAFEDCRVIVNGVQIDEPYIDLARQGSDGCGTDQPELVVPAGTVFVLGDSRGRSSDSRAFGPVPLSIVSGTMASSETVDRALP
jgi:signal peptidase I